MAKILISEPHEDVRMLLIAMAARLGHEPVPVETLATVPTDAQVLVFEPAEPGSLEHAQTLRRELPDLRLVCVSIKPPEPEWLELGPSAYVIKPFSLDSLDSALAAATLTLLNSPQNEALCRRNTLGGATRRPRSPQ